MPAPPNRLAMLTTMCAIACLLWGVLAIFGALVVLPMQSPPPSAVEGVLEAPTGAPSPTGVLFGNVTFGCRTGGRANSFRHDSHTVGDPNVVLRTDAGERIAVVLPAPNTRDWHDARADSQPVSTTDGACLPWPDGTRAILVTTAAHVGDRVVVAGPRRRAGQPLIAARIWFGTRAEALARHAVDPAVRKRTLTVGAVCLVLAPLLAAAAFVARSRVRSML